jgi:hypothetical protein
VPVYKNVPMTAAVGGARESLVLIETLIKSKTSNLNLQTMLAQMLGQTHAI